MCYKVFNFVVHYAIKSKYKQSFRGLFVYIVYGYVLVIIVIIYWYRLDNMKSAARLYIGYNCNGYNCNGYYWCIS